MLAEANELDAARDVFLQVWVGGWEWRGGGVTMWAGGRGPPAGGGGGGVRSRGALPAGDLRRSGEEQPAVDSGAASPTAS